MARLTDTTLRNLRFEGKAKKIFDDALPQFGVRVYKSGVSFIVMYGEERRMVTLGRYPDISLAEARRLALPYLGRKTRENVSVSYSEAVSDYLAEVRGTLRPSTYAQYERHLTTAPVSGPLRELTRHSFGDFLSRPHPASSLKVFMNWCVKNELIDRNILVHVPVRYNSPRERVLSDDELRAVWHTLSNNPFSIVVKLLILTGQRRNEVPHFQVEGDLVTIPATVTKNKRQHTFPVGTVTVPYLVPVQFNGWSKSKRRLDKQSGVTDWRLHDLRRSFVSIHSRLGTPIPVAEKLVNHISGTFAGVRGVYDRHSYMDEMRVAVANYERYILENVIK